HLFPTRRSSDLVSAKVTLRLLAQESAKVGVPKLAVAGHSMVASAGLLSTVGAVLSSTVIVCEVLTELPWASVAVQVRLVLLTSLPLTGRLVSAKVTLRLLAQESAKVGVPKLAVAGHSMVASAGLLATVGR